MSGTDLMPSPDVVAWRRIALEKQLPAPRLAAGVHAPALLCVWGLVVLAAVSAVYLGLTAGPQVPGAVIDSQERLVQGLARTLQASLHGDTDALSEIVETYAAAPQRDPATLLDTLTAELPEWTSAAVVDSATRQPVAVRGEPLAIGSVPAGVSRLTVIPVIDGSEPKAFVVAPLPDNRSLVAVRTLRPRALHVDLANQAIVLGSRSGDAVHLQGNATVAGAGRVPSVREAVAAAATTGRLATRRGVPPPAPQRPEPSEPAPDDAIVTVAAPVGSYGIAVASTIAAPVTSGGSRWRGALPASVLLATAIIAYLLTRRILVVPVRRLRDVAVAAACGDERRARVVRGPAEVRQIAHALGHPAERAREPARNTRSFPLTAGAVLIALLLLGGPAVMLVTMPSVRADIPAQVVVDSQNGVTFAASSLGESLVNGLAELRDVAAAPGDATSLRPTLDRLVRSRGRFRSVYLTGPDGAPSLVAGRAPLRRTEPVPLDAGIALDRQVDRLPVVYVYSARADGQVLVGEFDIAYLVALLHRSGARTRVVDADLRTVFDTEGYLAFERVTEEHGTDAAIEALVGNTRARVVETPDGATLLASTPLAMPPAAAQLEWAVIADQPVHALDLPVNNLRNVVIAAAGIAGGLILVTCGWQLFLHVRPLRQLARSAARLGRGDTQAVITPARGDEIGAIATCLDVYRQALIHGSGRLGGATRIRGDHDDFTHVMPRVPAQRTRRRGSRKAR